MLSFNSDRLLIGRRRISYLFRDGLAIDAFLAEILLLLLLLCGLGSICTANRCIVLVARHVNIRDISTR